MVLLPAGLMVAKEVWRNIDRKSGQMVRTSAMLSSNSLGLPPRRRRPQSSDIPGTSKVNPFEKSELLSRLGGTSIRRLHNDSKDEYLEERQDLDELLKDEKWYPVYRFRGIFIYVFMARMKLLQTIGSAVYLPFAGYQFFTGETSSSAFYLATGIAIVAPLVLIAFTPIITRIVGVISMTESGDFVRIGYLAFWGSRKNIILPLDDIVPLTESATTKGNVIKLFFFRQGHSGKSSLLIHTRKGAEIVDEEKANLLFGSLEMFDGEGVGKSEGDSKDETDRKAKENELLNEDKRENDK